MIRRIDVLAVMDDLIDFEERHAEYERRVNYEARDARIAMAEVIDRAKYLCRTGEGMLALRAAVARIGETV